MDLPLSRAVAPHLDWLPRAGSTNDVLVQSADGRPDFSVVVTDEQTAGRGRLGRTWVAPAGRTLAISVLLRPPSEVERERWGLLPLVAGAAMRRTVEAVLPAHPVALKWPNDVLVGEKKVSGILGELLPDARGLVLGAGLNVTLAADELPVPTATSLTLSGAAAADLGADGLLARYLDELGTLYRAWIAHGGDARASGLLDELAATSATLGRAVRVELPGGSVRTGTARAIDDDGRLVVDTDDGAPLVVAAGDVTHLRHSDGGIQR
ncbi:biotin--[acetyl-CoA-carboxylase] ligase [Herbiconiux liangxiaofengii]|uniref:biotin--[acetyl-CoA-carboxylase] ligase n=1 Tax=Herbiconiux liangxiaofengii TaxID=3342795 RepID=UPI0035B98F7F